MRKMGRLISDKFKEWENECEERFNTLKANEEELNRIFIDIYGLQDELTPEVEDKDVTVRKALLAREIKSLLSYAVGCIFGRYSLDVEGLAYAGGDFSDEWVVISGQYYRREVVEKLVSEQILKIDERGMKCGDELQRIDCLAEGDVASDGGLPGCEITSERGDVCFIRSDETGGNINSFKYRRGATKELYKGICPLSINSKRIESGTGNTTFDLCSAEILDAISSGNGSVLVSRGWEDAKLIDWKTVHYQLTTNHFGVSHSNIIPITDAEYFDDGIVARVAEFFEVVYGADTLQANLQYVGDVLYPKGDETGREKIRKYFLNDFYKDHVQTYKKRPIYWQFDSASSGKGTNAFKTLIYMHRYDKYTVARVRIDYLHTLQRKYEGEIKRLETMIDMSTDQKEVAIYKKAIDKIQKQIFECRSYDPALAHIANQNIEIDLDDGVVANYQKFQNVTATDKTINLLTRI